MTDASPRFRPVLDRFPGYQPGQTPASTTGRTHKLSSNESPHGPLPSVVEAIAEAVRSVHRYPGNGANALTEEIADRPAAESVRVPLAGETPDLTAMADAITARTRLIFVRNPNNPTHSVVHATE